MACALAYVIFFLYLCRKFRIMAQQELVKLFDSVKIRVVWDDDQEKYFFSIVDVVGVLTESVDGRKYWNKLKQRLREEGNESVTNCHQLKLPAADGKKYLTDVADTEQLLRIIQSIPSKKAEPFKQWLASVGAERIRQMRDPERSIEQIARKSRVMREQILSIVSGTLSSAKTKPSIILLPKTNCRSLRTMTNPKQLAPAGCFCVKTQILCKIFAYIKFFSYLCRRKGDFLN